MKNLLALTLSASVMYLSNAAGLQALAVEWSAGIHMSAPDESYPPKPEPYRLTVLSYENAEWLSIWAPDESYPPKP
ncbi:MAG: hypothetical protein HUJ54_10455, partial [Erysipelotrichaceae bacterium]|nr:hypothetical protein [Erysipelotrichaceae bacterium]